MDSDNKNIISTINNLLKKIASKNLYQRRFLVYLLVKGYGFAVKNSIHDKEQRSKVRLTHKFIKDIPNIIAGSEVTIFPEAVFISFPVTMASYFPQLLNQLAEIHFHMTNIGIACTGGVTIGQVYHEYDVIEGEGVKKLFEMVKNFAHYPFIMISSETIEEALSLMPLTMDSMSIRNQVWDYLSKEVGRYRYLDVAKILENERRRSKAEKSLKLASKDLTNSSLNKQLQIVV